MTFPTLPVATLLERLEPPTGPIRMVLDTDTYNEIDDQFAVVYSLLAPERLTVEAIYAAPFYNSRSTGPGDGMERSYEEILRLLDRLGVASEGFVFRGSDRYLPSADETVRSAAAEDLVERAMAGEEPLYVVAIGAITNVAAAILLEPRILERIVVVWLGGQPQWWHTAREFNLQQDLHASQLIFDCGVALVDIPCQGVASHLLTTVPEIDAWVAGRGPIGDYLAQIFREFREDQFGMGKVIWDISAIAWLLNADWVPSRIIHSPVLTSDFTWSVDRSRHFIREAIGVDRNGVFRDLFSRLARSSGE
ncbi:nucleoside hydrolase [bacterium]|nr:nucleoside hydrolase [bacterium]